MSGISWIDHAMDFAQAGVAVFPLGNGGKAPLANKLIEKLLGLPTTPEGKGGFHLATSNPEDIKKLNNSYAAETWVIGVPVPEGWAVVDVDTRKDDGKSALPDLLALSDTDDAEEQLRGMPHIRTPGGYHFFGLPVDGWRMCRPRDADGICVDTKVAGKGYIKAYAGTLEILQGKTKAFPEWVQEALRPRQSKVTYTAPTGQQTTGRGAIAWAIENIKNTPSGSGLNKALYSSAQFLASLGEDPHYHLTSTAQAAGIKDREIRRQINNGMNSEVAQVKRDQRRPAGGFRSAARNKRTQTAQPKPVQAPEPEPEPVHREPEPTPVTPTPAPAPPEPDYTDYCHCGEIVELGNAHNYCNEHLLEHEKEVYNRDQDELFVCQECGDWDVKYMTPTDDIMYCEKHKPYSLFLIEMIQPVI